MGFELDRTMALALARYQVVSTYLAMAPERGQRRALMDKLARRPWRLEDGSLLTLTSGDTIRAWVRRYQRDGLAGLKGTPRASPGSRVLTAALIDKACDLKRQVPERSIDRIITIMEALGHAEPGVLRRSTLHRALQRHGLSARSARVPDRHDLDRFQADRPNDLWQSDMLVGPWLPDPQRPGKMRRAHLYAFLDDHSRQLLHGRFSFKGDLPALELVFRRCLQKYGVPRKVYYDNGQVYRSHHMSQIVASLGIHRIVFTQPYRPMGHGKIEALNRFIRSNFLAELKASNVSTLDELNEAFIAFSDLEYNRRPHSELDDTPHSRWRAGVDGVRYADEELLHQAFLWQERRTTDKSGVLSLFGTRYQASARLARRRVEIRYDPEQLDEIELWHEGAFVERARPLDVRAHRRPRPTLDDAPPAPGAAAADPSDDYLNHLVVRRREEFTPEPSARQLADDAVRRRAEADQAVIALLAEYLDPAVFDEATAREFLGRFGPFDALDARLALESMTAERADHHIAVYLDSIHQQATGQEPTP